MTRAMTCREFVEFVWRYLSDEVTAAERLEFEYHLAQCTSCVSSRHAYTGPPSYSSRRHAASGQGCRRHTSTGQRSRCYTTVLG